MSRLNALIVSALCIVCSTALPVQALELTECELIGDRGIGRIQASCATLMQPLNPERPDDETIEVRVAVIRSLSPEPRPDAFTIINGGPGGSSISLYVQSAPVFEAIRRERDLVIVDQRGTGRSSPLDCPELEDPIEEFDLDLVTAATDRCLAALPHDPRYFTTSIAVQDLDSIRQQLGYEQWNIYGVSYGTRAALRQTFSGPGTIPDYRRRGAATAGIGPQCGVERATDARPAAGSLRGGSGLHVSIRFAGAKTDRAV